MKDEILKHQNNPKELERLYRTNKSAFKRDFDLLHQQLDGNPLFAFWSERLIYESDETNWGTRTELFFVIIASFLAGFIAKLPAFFPIDEHFYYARNTWFVIFPLLTLYFSWRNNLPKGKIALIAVAILVAIMFINILPLSKQSDTQDLSCIHLGLFLWSILGFAFIDVNGNKIEGRLSFLKYNGELLVMTALILITGMIMSGITVGLFGLIGLNITEFYFNYIGIFGLAAAPIVGTYITQNNPQLVGKVSPVIAKIFSPLVLLTLVVYLIANFYSAKNPYSDREYLIIFNLLLIGVMAIIFFSVAETYNIAQNMTQIWVVFLLSVTTVIINSVALSAILLRITEWGFTPNRTAVLGGNLLILINLVMVTTQLFKLTFRKSEIYGVGKVISSYLPIYFAWTVIVTFIFPLIFGFK